MEEVFDGSTQALLGELVLEMHDTNLTRYVSAVGMVLMLYDHVLSLSDEVLLVWNARPSFAKRLFLINRYLVVITQICVAVFMNHFSDDSFTKASCQGVVTIAFLLGITSAACANVLVILRVIALWDRDYRVAVLVALGFCASFITSLSFMISILRDSYDASHLYSLLYGFEYVTYVHTCTTLVISSKLPGVWASMMVFEVLVLVSVVFNALYRPRGRETPLRGVLYRDGIVFFTSLTGLQATNLVLSTAARPTLHMSGVFFVWALMTLVLNRSLLNIHKASTTTSSTHARQRGPLGGSVLVKTSVQSYLHCAGVSPVPVRMGVRVLSIESVSTEYDYESEPFGRSLADVPMEMEYAERVTANRHVHEHRRGPAPGLEGADPWRIELESRTRRAR